MKLTCDCGHVIVDQTDYLPYKALLARDEDFDRIWTTASEDLVKSLVADPAKRKEELGDRFQGISSSSDEWVITTYLGRLRREHMLRVYECERCGRLLVQRGPRAQMYVSFIPSSGQPEHILASELGSPVRKVESDKTTLLS
jgi:hypothetical protein